MVASRQSRPDRQSSKRSASVRSVLALAGGAAAFPLVESPVDAGIIVDNSLRGTVIGWNTAAGQTPRVSIDLLSGGGGFVIGTLATPIGRGYSSGEVGVNAGWLGPGAGRFRKTVGSSRAAYFATRGATVAAGTGSRYNVHVNFGNSYSLANIGNAAFAGTSKYLLFSFVDSDIRNYGWIELTATTTGFSAGKSNYSATLGDWAYDDSGATILAGQVPVPEPATATLAMGGALVAGAAGLRRWRKQRAAEAPAGT